MKAVVILSGGLDSTILTYKISHELGAENINALSFNYGQRQIKELEKAAITCQKLGILHRIIDLSVLGHIAAPMSANIAGSQVNMPTVKEIIGDPQPVTYVPNRNAILLMLAASFAEVVGAEQVYIGLQCHDIYSYWDTTPQFFEAMNNVLLYNRQHAIEILAPFVRMSKADEIKLGVQLGVPFEDTLTCYNPDNEGHACGICPSCAERIANFKLVGIIDPAPYQIEIDWNK
jgi:7-cyano-7-deazaguanine synthase